MNKKTGRPEEQPAQENRVERSAHYILPAKLDSVIAETLARFFLGEDQTHLGALDEMSTTRLAGRVFDLRRMGWDIRTERVTCRTRDGRTTPYARYHLPQSEIDRVPADKRAAWIETVFKARAKRRQA